MVVNKIMTDADIVEDIDVSAETNTWYGPLIISASNLISSLLPISALLYSLLHAI